MRIRLLFKSYLFNKKCRGLHSFYLSGYSSLFQLPEMKSRLFITGYILNDFECHLKLTINLHNAMKRLVSFNCFLLVSKGAHNKERLKIQHTLVVIITVLSSIFLHQKFQINYRKERWSICTTKQTKYHPRSILITYLMHRKPHYLRTLIRLNL